MLTEGQGKSTYLANVRPFWLGDFVEYNAMHGISPCIGAFRSFVLLSWIKVIKVINEKSWYNRICSIINGTTCRLEIKIDWEHKLGLLWLEIYTFSFLDFFLACDHKTIESRQLAVCL